LANVAKIIRAHHEYFNGSGYPHGLSGSQIPLGAQIISVVDAYVSMLEPRAFRPALSASEAQAELRRWSGVRYDPRIVEVFLAVLDSNSG
jgi:response regulator RpfG family c-di-GMP phosphodiesterase